ncbi:cyanophycinase [Oscillatoria sp. FACHB-1407]|uniref:cyanophycinase n=1 Tax=Oscillatoria sp. FACHB-1407 TaxID=2692847 RepID=UPI0016850771|nr:cyanophycinase [Oscillatoria sp. FACHB-1407]MBD2465147.1 cyanophycinase [Oscillatoria sp. FACHB-1407]
MVLNAQGQLMIIGGAEDKEGECKILREFVRRAGGLQARIVVMTVATGLPGEVGETYIGVFERLGVEDVRVVDTARREDASDPRAIEAIQKATGVFFTGGNQARITECLKDTELDTILHTRFAEGLVIAGTSAGAAMMPDMMIVEGEGETNPRMEVVTMDRGMGFLPGVVIDQHFAQRGRLGRLLSAVAQQPAEIGFGIDENTAIAVNGHEIEVIGEHSITVVDVADITHSNVGELLKDEPLALCNAKLHILPHGYRFDLKTRTCVC